MAKKIKKVETPIDQRETFVSLQKNFADSDLSVEEKLKVLYDLQKADVAIDKIIQLRGELPDEVEALENEVADLKAKVAQETEVTPTVLRLSVPCSMSSRMTQSAGSFRTSICSVQST